TEPHTPWEASRAPAPQDFPTPDRRADFFRSRGLTDVQKPPLQAVRHLSCGETYERVDAPGRSVGARSGGGPQRLTLLEVVMLPIRKILHPTDFSEHSEPAFRLACSLARDYGAPVVVLHVTSPSAVAYPEGLFVLPPALNVPDLDDYLV